ncbi:hypothetical protein BH10PSE3_BH10PSE3_40240 [soil metagenome]
MSAGSLLVAALTALPPHGGVLPGEAAAYDAMLASQARTANNVFAGSVCADAKAEPVSIRQWKIVDHPELIVWREKVRVTGCGHTAIENVNIGRVDGSPPWRMTTGLPGDSLADMTLQASAFPAATAEARTGLAAECQSVSLSDVYVAALPGGVDVTPSGAPTPHVHGRLTMGLPDTAMPMLDKLALSEAWMEVWPLNICGHDRTLGVVFIPMRDHSASMYFFLPIWPQIEANGPGARPAAVSLPE